jgi:hypothetical protein
MGEKPAATLWAMANFPTFGVIVSSAYRKYAFVIIPGYCENWLIARGEVVLK